MKYKKETPFDQLTYETLMFLADVTIDHDMYFSGLGYQVRQEILASLVFKANKLGIKVPKKYEIEINDLG